MEVGKIPVNVLTHSVLGQLQRNKKNGGTGLGVDCAVFSLPEGTSLAVCTREGAVTERDESVLDEQFGILLTIPHLITKCANNLAAGGAKVLGFELTLFLPENTEYTAVKELMKRADRVAENMDALIYGGQTRVLPGIQQILAVVSGYGAVPEALSENTDWKNGVLPGQSVILTKWIGLEGTALYTEGYQEAIKKQYPAYLVERGKEFAKLLSVIPEAAVAVRSGVCAMHDASEGGIFASLWELAEGAGVGLDLDLRKIPIKQETVEIAEICGFNPYELLSGGCMVMTSFHGEQLVEALEKEGIPAVIIGQTTKDKAKIIRNEDELRYMDRPKADEIYHRPL